MAMNSGILFKAYTEESLTFPDLNCEINLRHWTYSRFHYSGIYSQATWNHCLDFTLSKSGFRNMKIG